MRPKEIFVLIGVILFILPGCAGPGKHMKSPRIHISDIRPGEMKPLEAVFLVELRVLNTNDIPLKVKGIDCELEVNDRRFASGVGNVAVEIPAFGTGTVPVTVYSSVIDTVRGLFSFKGREKLKYRIFGRLSIEGGFLLPSSIPFESQGELDLKSPPDS